jgi:hypothetical protein
MPSLLADDLRTATATIRPFRPDPVQPAALHRAARRAGVAPWRLRTITDPLTRRAIRDVHLPHWQAHLAATGALKVLAADNPAGLARQLRRADAFVGQLDEVPVHLAVLARRAGTTPPDLLDDLREALRAEGFDASPVPLTAEAGPELREVLALPEDLLLHGILVARPQR